MPAKRRRRRARREAWSDCHVSAMISGMRYLGAFGSHREPWPEDQVHLAWADLRDEIMAEYRVKEPTLRPWAWWVVDQGLPRPLRKCSERRWLLENGILDAEERAMLAADLGLLEPTPLELKYFREVPPFDAVTECASCH